MTIESYSIDNRPLHHIVMVTVKFRFLGNKQYRARFNKRAFLFTIPHRITSDGINEIKKRKKFLH